MPALPRVTTTVSRVISGSRRVETGVVVVTIPPHADRVAIWASVGLAGRGLSVISMRSDITAEL
jgi:hypothetical protein